MSTQTNVQTASDPAVACTDLLGGTEAQYLIQELRKKLSDAQIAKLVRLSPSYIWRLRVGTAKNISAKALDDLRRAAGKKAPSQDQQIERELNRIQDSLDALRALFAS